MALLYFFYRSSYKRTSWLLLAGSALTLQLIALYFQHVRDLQPCVLCIYERCALFGVLAAGLLGFIAPTKPLLRYAAIFLWIYSAWQGAQLTWKHTLMQFRPSPFDTCDFFVRFPQWLPLDKWLPTVFHASGDCSVQQWSWLQLDMPQWLLGIFVFYLSVACLTLISQPFNKPPRQRLFKN